MALHERQPEPVDPAGVVRVVLFVFGERNRLGHLLRFTKDLHRHAELVERGHRRGVETGNRTRLEGHLTVAAVRGAQVEDMVDEVELDLEPVAPACMSEVVSPRAETYSVTCHQ